MTLRRLWMLLVVSRLTPAGCRRRRALAATTRAAIGALAGFVDGGVRFAEDAAVDIAAERLGKVLELSADLTEPVRAQLLGTLRSIDAAKAKVATADELRAIRVHVHGLANIAAWEWAVL